MIYLLSVRGWQASPIIHRLCVDIINKEQSTKEFEKRVPAWKCATCFALFSKFSMEKGYLISTFKTQKSERTSMQNDNIRQGTKIIPFTGSPNIISLEVWTKPEQSNIGGAS